MHDLLIAPFADFEFMRRALVGAFALALAGAPIGVFLILRRMALSGDAMAHAILPGAALGYLVAGLSLPAMTLGGLAAGFAVALLSGALAGLAGAIEVAGRTSYVTLDMSPGYGYSGIVIAMLAALNPLGVVAAAVFVAGVLVGADSMSRAVGVPTYIADVIVATSLIAVLVAGLLAQYRVRWK